MRISRYKNQVMFSEETSICHYGTSFRIKDIKLSDIFKLLYYKVVDLIKGE